MALAVSSRARDAALAHTFPVPKHLLVAESSCLPGLLALPTPSGSQKKEAGGTCSAAHPQATDSDKKLLTASSHPSTEAKKFR